MTSILIEQLVDAARARDERGIDRIVLNIAKINDLSSIAWAVTEGLRHLNDNVRIAAAKILGKQEVASNVIDYVRYNLYELMKNDPNVSARYRAAITLAKIGPESYGKDVRSVLDQAEKVRELRPEAQQAIQSLGDCLM